MKKTFKKFITTTLAVIAITNLYPTWAIVSDDIPPQQPIASEAIPSPEVTTKSIEELTKEFENIATGVFYVDPYFSSPENKNPETTRKILKQATEIFKQYPHITKRFITQIQQCTYTKKFFIKPVDEKHRKFISLAFKDLNPLGLLGFYDEDPEAISILIDVDEISKFQAKCQEQAKLNPTLPIGNVGSDTTHFDECCITHEIGHLFESVIEFSEIGKDAYKNYLDVVSKTRCAVLEKSSASPSEAELQRIIDEISLPEDVIKSLEYKEPTPEQKHDILIEILRGKSRKIKDRIASKGGADTFVSIYGEFNEKEWFAELFSRAHCLKGKHTKLDKTMLDYLQNFEKRISKIEYFSEALSWLPPKERQTLEEFKKLAPNNFFISPTFLDPKGGYSAIIDIIKHVTDIFKRFPKIKEKFIKQLQQCTELQMFTVKSFPSKARPEMFSTPPYDEDTEEFSLFLCPEVLKETHDCAHINIANIMGDLIYSTICYSKDPQLWVSVSRDIKKIMASTNLSMSELPELLRLMIMYQFARYSMLSAEIKQQIIEIAKTKYGYTGEGFISQMGELHSQKWFTEVFTHALCSSELTPLDHAMIEYLDTFEKSL